jgi:prepilin-type processing-associated H-X9-DG protein
MWKTFWGDDFDKLLPSNTRAVVPAAWRIEVSPSQPAKEDFFLHVMEIGDRGDTRTPRVELVDGSNLVGALLEGGTVTLFATIDGPVTEGEVTIPAVDTNWFRTCGFKSLHTNGANFVMGDGSVRFLAQTIDYRLYNALGTRAGVSQRDRVHDAIRRSVGQLRRLWSVLRELHSSAGGSPAALASVVRRRNVLRVFVSEYVCGGAWPVTVTPVSSCSIFSAVTGRSTAWEWRARAWSRKCSVSA